MNTALTRRIRTMSYSMYSSCEKCGVRMTQMDLERLQHVCPKCGFHATLSARKRIQYLTDPGSFRELNAHMEFADPICFPGYEEKHRSMREKTSLDDSIVTGSACIDGRKVALGVMDSAFIMGSMGVILGEKIALLFEYALDRECPVILVTASGGARMQEGMAALLQMTKTSSLIGVLNEQGIPLFCVLTDPTMGGVTASFAMLGDVILAEPNALIGFAGPRVIRQTIGQELPEGFQRSERLLQCGFIDQIVPRERLRDTLALLIDTHAVQRRESAHAHNRQAV